MEAHHVDCAVGFSDWQCYTRLIPSPISVSPCAFQGLRRRAHRLINPLDAGNRSISKWPAILIHAKHVFLRGTADIDIVHYGCYVASLQRKGTLL